MSAASPLPAGRLPLWRRTLFPIVLMMVILVAHGPSLHFGLFMDDYAHYQQLQEADWSLAGLTAACRLELVGGVLEMWWLPDCTLRFFRPVAFGLMKLVYELSNWSPMAAHAASLAWHAAVGMLLWRLMLRLGIGGTAAGWATVLFALHPGHTATVQWIASQSELMVTTFALLTAHLWLSFCTKPGVAARIALPAVSFALALGCRENAIVLPVILLGAWLSGCWFAKGGVSGGAQVAGAAPRRAWSAFAVLMATAAVYLVVRAVSLGGGAVPPRPYVVPPTAPDFLPYVVDKFLYYLLAEFWLVPAVPIGGLQYFRQVPLVFYGVSLATAGALAWWVWARREHMAVRLGALWLVLAMAPVLPVFESPHHLYLPGVGWALLAAAAFDRIFPRSATAPAARGEAPATPRGVGLPAAIARIGVLAAFLSFAVLSHFNTLALEAARQVEDAVVSEVIAGVPDLRDGDTIYFANLPIIAHYLKLAVEQETGRRDLRCVALTWAPRVVGVRGPTECVRIDEHTLEIAVADDRFFSGPFGTLVAQANDGRHAADLLMGGMVRTGYAVSLVVGDADGIERLRVRFDEPWSTDGRHVFWGSAARWAVRLDSACLNTVKFPPR